MKIAVCVNQVPDITAPFHITEEMESLSSEQLIPIVNPADLSALALLHQINLPEDTRITVLTVGPESTERAMRTCISCGSDDAVRIWDDELAKGNNSPDVIARVIAAAVSKLDFDLVVCGSQSLDQASGYVGPAIAEYLGIASICSISQLEVDVKQKKITCHRRLEHGDREIVAVDFPAVITVDAGRVEIPYASLPDLIAAERHTITVMDSEAINFEQTQINPGREKFLYYIPPKPRTKKTAQSSAALNPAQMMQQMTGGGAKQGGNIVEGEPQKAAKEIIKYLQSKGILIS